MLCNDRGVTCNAITHSPGVLSLRTFARLTRDSYFIRGSPRLALSASGGSSERAGLTLLLYYLSRGFLFTTPFTVKSTVLPLNRKIASVIGLCCTAYNSEFTTLVAPKRIMPRLRRCAPSGTPIVSANTCINMYRIIYVSISINDYYYISVYLYI